MDEEISEGLRIINKYWGKEDRFHGFCNYWVREVNVKFFSGKLPEIKIQIVPVSIFSILFPSNAGARYENNLPQNTISIGINLLTEDHSKIRAVLLHELVHIWERNYSIGQENYTIPIPIQKIIKEIYKNNGNSFHGHSTRFISKLHDICKESGTQFVLSRSIDERLKKGD